MRKRMIYQGNFVNYLIDEKGNIYSSFHVNVTKPMKIYEKGNARRICLRINDRNVQVNYNDILRENGLGATINRNGDLSLSIDDLDKKVKQIKNGAEFLLNEVDNIKALRDDGNAETRNKVNMINFSIDNIWKTLFDVLDKYFELSKKGE